MLEQLALRRIMLLEDARCSLQSQQLALRWVKEGPRDICDRSKRKAASTAAVTFATMRQRSQFPAHSTSEILITKASNGMSGNISRAPFFHGGGRPAACVRVPDGGS